MRASRGSPVIIQDEIISEQRLFGEYVLHDAGFRRFLFAFRASSNVQNSNEDKILEEHMHDNDDARVISNGVRKLFKLGKAMNVPRGASGRVSSAHGTISSARDQYDAALRAEQATKKSLEAKKA